VNARLATMLLVLCLALPARAQETPEAKERWGVLLSAGVGLFSGTAGGATSGHLLSTHLFVVTPVGLGADVRIYGPLGATFAGAYQFCDMVESETSRCAGAGLTVALGPRLRF
jgi:hypothetical protein